MPSAEEIHKSIEDGLINDFDDDVEDDEEIEIQEEEEEEETFIRQSFTTMNHAPINKPQVLISSNQVSNINIDSQPKVSQTESSSLDNPNSSSQKDLKKQLKPIYERLVGKPEFSIEPLTENNIKKMSMRNVVATWFSRESYLDRAIRIHLRSFRNKLQLEIQVIQKAHMKYKKKIAEQLHEFEKQEKQLTAWGLKIALPRFHLQAWYRLERNKLQELIIKLYEDIFHDKLVLAVNCVNSFDEKLKRSNRVTTTTNNNSSSLIPSTFTIETVNNFCNMSESLLETSPIFMMHCLRLTQLDILCSLATKQFIQLEPNFIFKDREKKLIKILKSYTTLPSLRESENLIDKGIDWSSFCHWLSVRFHKLKSIELEFSDFIEDQREMEGRLFFRWYTSVMMASSSSMYYQTNNPSNSNANTSTAGTTSANLSNNPSQNTLFNSQNDLDPNGDGNNDSELNNQQNLAALYITPTSIKAFIRYFATDVVGNKYDIPKELINANIELTENLFYKRIYSLIFRYNDASHRQLDDYWRIQSHRCLYVNPNYYHVPDKYYQSNKWKRENISFLNNYFSPSLYNNEAKAFQSSQNSTKEDINSLSSSVGSSPITMESILVGGVPVLDTRRSRAYSKSNITNTHANSTPVASAVSSPQAPGSNFTSPNKLPSKASTTSPRPRCTCNYCMSLTMSSRLQRPPSNLSIRYNSLKESQKYSTNSFSCPTLNPLLHLSSYPSHGTAFSHSIRTLSLLSLCSTPRDLLYTLSLSFKWVIREAHEAGFVTFKEKWQEKNGNEPMPTYSPSIIGADQLVPIFTLVLIHSNIPQLHLLLYIMTRYGEYEEQGDISYNLANLEGSLYFAMSLDVDEYFSKLNQFVKTELKLNPEFATTSNPITDIKVDVLDLSLDKDEVLHNTSIPIGRRDPYIQSMLYSIIENDAMMNGTTNSHAYLGSHADAFLLNDSPVNSEPTACVQGIDKLKVLSEPPPLIKSLFNRSTEVTPEDISSMEELGEWLRDQQNMEDTIAILQKDGWML